MSLDPSVIFSAAGGSNTFSGITAASATSSTGVSTVDVPVPTTTTDQLYTIAIDVSEVEVVFLYTDGDLTLETNATDATGGQTLIFAANKPLVWVRGMPIPNPLTPDITKFYLTNAGASTVTLRGFIGQSL